jgi:hypothetical protein
VSQTSVVPMRGYSGMWFLCKSFPVTEIYLFECNASGTSKSMKSYPGNVFVFLTNS